MPINFKKTILLTGAGFTKNFGGFLGSEMWSKIFNNPKIDKLSEIKEMLHNDFNFENVYANVINSNNFAIDQRKLFQEIILESYKDMDDMVKNYTFTGRDPYGVNFSEARKLLGSFAGNGQEVGVHFTLNQDLFLERKVQRKALGLSGPEYKDYAQQIESRRLDTSKSIILPDQTFIEEFKTKHLSSVGNLVYVKLHGSYGWSSATGDNQMILGINKLKDIKKEPLLNWYFELFEQTLYRNEVKLFIIGYGFTDEHINNCLLKAVSKYNTRLYIISPESPEILKNRLEGRPKNSQTIWEPKETAKIWDAIAGYYPYKFKEIFPSDQSKTHVWGDIKRNI